MNNIQSILAWSVLGVFGAGVFAQANLATEESDSSSALKSIEDHEQDSVSVYPGILLVEQDQQPSVAVSWVANGQDQKYTATLPYSAPTGGDPLGKNVKCYVTMGGTRIETGAGHPKGAVLRLGITKIDSSKAFFAGIDPGTQIEFAITGVRFNQPIKIHEGTGLMHLKYAIGDLQACELPANARNQYLLSDPQDTLGGRVNAGVNATPGALDGKEGHGQFIIEIDQDDPTLVTMRIRVPFGQLRHLQDPWKSELPGTFFEPIHMHAEAEFIPVGVEPLDRDPIVPEVNTPPNDTDDAE